MDCNILGKNIRDSDSIDIFKKCLLSFIRILPNNFPNSKNLRGLKLLIKLLLGLNHQRDFKFKHNFFDTMDPFCSFGSDIETPCHFFLY